MFSSKIVRYDNVVVLNLIFDSFNKKISGNTNIRFDTLTIIQISFTLKHRS